MVRGAGHAFPGYNREEVKSRTSGWGVMIGHLDSQSPRERCTSTHPLRAMRLELAEVVTWEEICTV